MRIYDPRAGRFLSVDPLAASYPWYTPYQFAGNTPIQAIDLDGLEPAYSDNGRMVAGREPTLARTPPKPQIKSISYIDLIKSIKPAPSKSISSKPAPDVNNNQARSSQASGNGGSGLFNSTFYLAGGQKWGDVGAILDGHLLGVGGNEVEYPEVSQETNGKTEPESPIVENEPEPKSMGSATGTTAAGECWRNGSAYFFPIKSDEVGDFISTEPDAQSRSRMDAMKATIQQNDPVGMTKLLRETIEAVAYNGKIYVLNGHNRLTAYSESEGKTVTVTILSMKEAESKYKDKMEDVKNGDFTKTIKDGN